MATPAQQEAIAQRVLTSGGEAETNLPREYVVLRADDSGRVGGWTEVKRTEATTSDAAIRAAAAEREGTYVAVPARSWNPRTLAVKTEKRVSLS